MASPPRCRRVSACEATLAVLFVVAVLVNVTLISLMATWKTPTGEVLEYISAGFTLDLHKF